MTVLFILVCVVVIQLRQISARILYWISTRIAHKQLLIRKPIANFNELRLGHFDLVEYALQRYSKVFPRKLPVMPPDNLDRIRTQQTLSPELHARQVRCPSKSEFQK